MMIKAIIFDCFGVLATEAWLPFKATYFSDNPEKFEEASDLAKRANAGLISHQDFIAAAAKMADITPLEAEQFISRNVPNEELFETIKELKKSYKIGFLSNIAGNFLHRMFTKEQLATFDTICLSFETGLVKPDPQSFLDITKKLGVEPSEAIMVDDQERQITGAREAGLQAILFTDAEQYKKDLITLLKQLS